MLSNSNDYKKTFGSFSSLQFYERGYPQLRAPSQTE